MSMTRSFALALAVLVTPACGASEPKSTSAPEEVPAPQVKSSSEKYETVSRVGVASTPTSAGAQAPAVTTATRARTPPATTPGGASLTRPQGLTAAEVAERVSRGAVNRLTERTSRFSRRERWWNRATFAVATASR